MLDAGCFVARAVFQTSGYLRPGADDKSQQDRRNKEGKRRVADGLSSARGGALSPTISHDVPRAAAILCKETRF